LGVEPSTDERSGVTIAPMSTVTTNLNLCERLFAAITAGDTEAVRAIYAEDAVIWHNNDGLEQTPEENLRVLRWVVRNVKDLRYEEIRRHETPTGFVQQHVLRGMAPNGTALEIPACIVCTVKDGRITRLEEYLDSAHTAALVG
jgi:ketosteroid isomerase-like protein